MAPPVGTLATADAILKDLLTGPIREQLNYKTYLLDRIERDSDNIDMRGRRVIMPVEATGNESPTSLSDGGTLATPQVATEQDLIALVRGHDGGLELSDQLIKTATGDNAGAFVNVLKRQGQKLADSMRKNINRQAFGTGDGVLATLTSSPAASTTFTVDSTQYLRVNMVIDVLTKSTGAGTGAGRTITAINRATKTITVDTAVTATTTTDGVYKEGARNLEMDGLRNITAKGRTLHGINSATAGNEFWNGSERDAGGGVAGESLFEQLADDVGGNGQGDVEVFLTSRGIRRRLADTYQSQKRFNDARAVDVHGGYTAIYVNEIPVISDDDAPKGWAFALRDDALVWGQIEDPDWLTDPRSGVAFQMKTNTGTGRKQAAWQAWMIWYAALVSPAPNRTGRIINAADDSA